MKAIANPRRLYVVGHLIVVYAAVRGYQFLLSTLISTSISEPRNMTLGDLGKTTGRLCSCQLVGSLPIGAPFSLFVKSSNFYPTNCRVYWF